MPEAQSPTLMIQGVLGGLAPGEEIVEVLGAVEERRAQALL